MSFYCDCASDCDIERALKLYYIMYIYKKKNNIIMH